MIGLGLIKNLNKVHGSVQFLSKVKFSVFPQKKNKNSFFLPQKLSLLLQLICSQKSTSTLEKILFCLNQSQSASL